jgi:hypothetical protein
MARRPADGAPSGSKSLSSELDEARARAIIYDERLNEQMGDELARMSDEDRARLRRLIEQRAAEESGPHAVRVHQNRVKDERREERKRAKAARQEEKAARRESDWERRSELPPVDAMEVLQAIRVDGVMRAREKVVLSMLVLAAEAERLAAEYPDGLRKALKITLTHEQIGEQAGIKNRKTVGEAIALLAGYAGPVVLLVRPSKHGGRAHDYQIEMKPEG